MKHLLIGLNMQPRTGRTTTGSSLWIPDTTWKSSLTTAGRDILPPNFTWRNIDIPRNMEGSWQNHLCQVFDRPRKHPTPRVERVSRPVIAPPAPPILRRVARLAARGCCFRKSMTWRALHLPQKFLAGNWRFRKKTKRHLSPVSPVVTKHIKRIYNIGPNYN